MRASRDCYELIKRFEGFSSTPYPCPAGVWTIGYGTTNGVTMHSEPISREYAEELLRDDVSRFEDAVNRYVKVPLTQNQFDALVSWTYNVGEGALKKSTLLKKLNKGEYDKVPYELARWNKADGNVLNGLTRRRAAEADLWSQSDTIDYIPRNGIDRDVPTIVNKENVSAAVAGASGVGLSNMSADNPISWALALIMVVGAAVFLYLFLRRRGA